MKSTFLLFLILSIRLGAAGIEIDTTEAISLTTMKTFTLSATEDIGIDTKASMLVEAMRDLVLKSRGNTDVAAVNLTLSGANVSVEAKARLDASGLINMNKGALQVLP